MPGLPTKMGSIAAFFFFFSSFSCLGGYLIDFYFLRLFLR